MKTLTAHCGNWYLFQDEELHNHLTFFNTVIIVMFLEFIKRLVKGEKVKQL
jgi:hypothetical protein